MIQHAHSRTGVEIENGCSSVGQSAGLLNPEVVGSSPTIHLFNSMRENRGEICQRER